jgi:GT2 family glycosyltransferase
MKKIYIIVLNYNNAKDTIECLESLYKLDYDLFHVVVCDNSSTDDSENKIKKWQVQMRVPNFTFIQTNKNRGYAGGNNVGIRFAMKQGDMDYVWILNNDTIVMPDSLSAVVKKMESDSTLGICGSKLVYSWDKSRVQSLGGHFNKYLGTTSHIINEKKLNCMNFVIGAAMLISNKFLQEIGLFCEDYFLYYEEIDLSMRAIGKYRMACALDSIVYHKEGASIGANDKDKNQKSLLGDFYSVRNRILFMKKYYPNHLFSVYLGLLITIVNRLRRHQRKRINMIVYLIKNPQSTYDEYLKNTRPDFLDK